MVKYDINRDKIVSFIKSGEKLIDFQTIGLEFEHIIACKETFKSISYEEGIDSVMEELLTKGWQKNDDEPSLINLVKDQDTITLEPGGQLELSVKNSNNINEMKERYFSFINDILPILESNDFCLLSIGYHPVDSIKDISWLPKKRYEYMSEYLGSKGKYALNMMKGTAALQVSMDFFDEEDYIKKNRVANFLSPAISLLFDNTPIFEGKLHEGNTARVSVWNNMDDERSGIIPGALDKEFGYEDYADYIMERPCIIALLDGKYVYTKDLAIKEIYKDIEMDEKQIEHILSMFFPDVRTKKYIEIRMADSVPYPYNFSAAVLWKGLLYDEDNLNFFYSKSKLYSNEDINLIKMNMVENDEATLKYLKELIGEIFSKVLQALDEQDKEHLKPLIELHENYLNLSTYIKGEIDEGLSSALEPVILSVKNLNRKGIR